MYKVRLIFYVKKSFWNGFLTDDWICVIQSQPDPSLQHLVWDSLKACFDGESFSTFSARKHWHQSQFLFSFFSVCNCQVQHTIPPMSFGHTMSVSAPARSSLLYSTYWIIIIMWKHAHSMSMWLHMCVFDNAHYVPRRSQHAGNKLHQATHLSASL